MPTLPQSIGMSIPSAAAWMFFGTQSPCATTEASDRRALPAKARAPRPCSRSVHCAVDEARVRQRKIPDRGQDAETGIASSQERLVVGDVPDGQVVGIAMAPLPPSRRERRRASVRAAGAPQRWRDRGGESPGPRRTPSSTMCSSSVNRIGAEAVKGWGARCALRQDLCVDRMLEHAGLLTASLGDDRVRASCHVEPIDPGALALLDPFDGDDGFVAAGDSPPGLSRGLRRRGTLPFSRISTICFRLSLCCYGMGADRALSRGRLSSTRRKAQFAKKAAQDFFRVEMLDSDPARAAERMAHRLGANTTRWHRPPPRRSSRGTGLRRMAADP